MFDQKMLKENKIYRFYEQVKQEIKKVIWLKFKELQLATLIVMIVVSICSLVCLVVDYAVHSLVQMLVNIH